MKLPVVGRDERPRSSVDVWAWVGLKARKRGEAPESAASAVDFLSASGWAWVELGDRGWLKPPTPEEGLLDVNHSRGSILARQFKDGEVAASGDAPATMGKKKRISRRAAKTPREEGELNLERVFLTSP